MFNEVSQSFSEPTFSPGTFSALYNLFITGKKSSPMSEMHTHVADTVRGWPHIGSIGESWSPVTISQGWAGAWPSI